MKHKTKRILWLINHGALRGFEAPLLCRLGYELFLPKCFPQTEGFSSDSVDYSYDQTLSIPPDALEKLNQHDFYTETLSPEIAEILNRYFCAAICTFSPHLFEQIVYGFLGKIFLRAFGKEEKSSYSLACFAPCFSCQFSRRLQQIQNRFFFAQAYPFLLEVEEGPCAKHAITLPLGLSEDLLSEKGSWQGGNGKLLFVCPRIASSAYCADIYAKFKKEFSDIPHLIAGRQWALHADPTILGNLPTEAYRNQLQSAEVMFYHSEEPRHLHYHPLEAIVMGLPLIFMKKGMLGRLVDCTEIPGGCDTIQEAKEKISRILQGDKEFVREVQKAQESLLKPFETQYCETIWKREFVPLLEGNHPRFSEKKCKKIAVLLPIPYRGGSLRGAKNIAKMIHLGSRIHNEPVEVVFSCQKGAYSIQDDFSDLLALGISIRETQWQNISTRDLQILGKEEAVQQGSSESEYLFPTDGISDFADCDFHLLISDRTSPPLLPTLPYGIVVYDYIQRYVPHLLDPKMEKDYLKTARQASFVITTTPQTQGDAIQYGGVNAQNVLLFPMEFRPPNEPSSSISPHPRPYFLWVTNPAIHKNHIRALQALEHFYNNEEGDLDLVVLGVGTELLLDSSKGNPFLSIREAAHYLQKNPALRERCHFKREVSDAHYSNYLAHAQFLWHPALIDNGTFAVMEAAYLGVPSLSSDYPAMRYIDERFKLNLLFFDPYSSSQMGKTLKVMQREANVRKSLLPERSHLDQFTADHLASDFWMGIKERI